MTGKEEVKCRSCSYHQTLEIHSSSTGSENGAFWFIPHNWITEEEYAGKHNFLGRVGVSRVSVLTQMCAACELPLSQLDVEAVGQQLCRHMLIEHPPNMFENLIC